MKDIIYILKMAGRDKNQTTPTERIDPVVPAETTKLDNRMNQQKQLKLQHQLN